MNLLQVKFHVSLEDGLYKKSEGYLHKGAVVLRGEKKQSGTLHCLTEGLRITTVPEIGKSLAKQFLDSNPDLLLDRDELLNTPLQLACTYGDQEGVFVNLLLEYNKSSLHINAKNLEGMTAIQRAAINGNFSSFESLLREGAVVENKAPSNTTLVGRVLDGIYRFNERNNMNVKNSTVKLESYLNIFSRLLDLGFPCTGFGVTGELDGESLMLLAGYLDVYKKIKDLKYKK